MYEKFTFSYTQRPSSIKHFLFIYYYNERVRHLKQASIIL